MTLKLAQAWPSSHTTSDSCRVLGVNALLGSLPRREPQYQLECPLIDAKTPAVLRQSLRVCEQITRTNSRSFFLSSQLLPAAKRQAIRVLYAFCRTSDDIVDLPHQSQPANRLANWLWLVSNREWASLHPVLPAWHQICQRFELPDALVKELLAGVAMDLTISRYKSFEDLWLYCYRVASVVGLLSMQIIGFQTGAEPYAIKLGVALQLTNILRDVAEDAQRGRIYLPQEDLEHFDLSDDDILAGVHDERFQALMEFEIARARKLYEESWAGIGLLSADGRLAVAAASRFYGAILDKIVAQNYNVYKQRAHLTTSEKLRMLPKLWHDTKQLGT